MRLPYVLIAALAATTPAAAADLPSAPKPVPLPTFAASVPWGFYIRAGVTGLFIDGGAAVTIAGQPQPNGNATIPAIPVSYIEGGYFVTKAIAVSIAAGYPPTLSSYGTGTFAPFGKLYATTAGVATATVHYHLDFGRLHPYLGGGLGYAIVFHNSPAAIQSANLQNAFAPVLVGGADVEITDHVSFFFDVKKIWLSQKFTGTIAPVPGVPVTVPVVARLRTDPLLTTAGIGYRF